MMGIAKTRKTWVIGILVLVLVTVTLNSGCTKLGDDFRTAAGPELEAGLTSVMSGLVSGAFEVFEPGTESDSTSTGGES